MSPCLADLAAPSAWPPPWDSGRQGAFVTALCQDRRGDIYAATEGNGIARWDGHAWTQFTAENTGGGLGDDDCYSLTCDRLGRLWVGTDRSGVSVYNGKAWKTYDRLTGPPGCHVVALTTSPLTGDVFGATEAGIFSYSLKTNTWHDYSRADGLPSDACSCLAFAPGGTLYAGTQADGLAISTPASGYRAWRVVPGPAVPPPSPGGDGLPSALVNSLLVAHDGTIYCATDDGLAHSTDGGHSWRFLRGADWQDMVKGEWHGPAPVATDTGGRLLAEDYVTALAEDGSGNLFIGHRRKGIGVYGEAAARGLTPPEAYGGYVDALLAQGKGRVLIGTYGDGLASLSPPDAPATSAVAAKAPASFPPLPAPAAPPTLAQLNLMLRAVEAVRPDPQEYRPHAVALDQDWATRGDWLGRYGRYWACLFAICSPSDYQWGAGWEPVNYASQMGPDHDPGDSLRYWVQWLYTADPRVLEMPPTYLDSRIKKGLTDGSRPRREAEQDDHNEARDAISHSGPGVYETVTVPPGLYVLSVYEMNKDGQSWDNRFRDYRLSVRPHAASDLADISGFDREPEWAHGRVCQFWGGVWERFLVRGPVTLDVAVDRNHSLNTIVQSVTLDLVDETPPPYLGTVDDWEEAQAQQISLWRSQLAQHRAAPFAPATSPSEAAGRLLAALSRAQAINSAWWGVNGRRFSLPLARWYAAQAARPGARPDAAQWRRLATCEYAAGLYPQWEDALRQAGLTPARDIEKALRWDGVSNEGQDFEVVLDYRATQKQRMSIAKIVTETGQHIWFASVLPTRKNH